MNANTKKLVTMAMLGAISVILVIFIHFPLFPAAPFLEYDPADVPIILGTLLFGPVNGVILTIVVSIIQGMTVSAHSGVIGIIMHIFATGSFALVAGFIFKKNKSALRLTISLLLGVITMTLTMILWNLIFTPIYMGVPFSVVKDMILPVILPFNLIKASSNAVFAGVLYTILKAAIRE